MVKLADTLAPLGNYPVAESKDVSIDINGTEKSIQQAYDDGDLSGGGSSIQTDVMPIPSSEYEDKIVQYIGESGTYKNGYFYKCQAVEGSSPTQYEWVEQEVQESKDSTPHWSGTRSEYEEVKDTLEVGTYISITDDYENEVIQWSVMPDANSDYLGKIVQYVGETNNDYTNGYFYECRIVEGSDPYVYEWKAKEVQKSTVSKSIFYSDVIEEVIDYEVGEVFCYTSDDEGKFKKGHFYKKENRSDWLYEGMVTSIAKRFYFESQDMKQGEYVYVETPSRDGVYACYVIAYSYTNNDDTVVGLKNLHTSDTSEYTISYTTKSYMSNIFDWTDINGSSQTEVMPTASADNVGKIVQYVGESGTYQKGYFYECILAHNGTKSTYVWEDVDHLRFNHVVYHCTVPPANEEYKPGDIIYYSGKTMGNFKNGYYYRAIPNATPQQHYGVTFWTTPSSGTGYLCYTPFELRIGFIVYPTGTGGTSYPYEITGFDDTGITITPYGWSGEDRHYVGVYYTETVEGWEELEGGGGTSIFYGTMDEWNALTADEKKQYDYMADEDETSSSVYPSAPTTPEIVFDKLNQSSNIDATYTVDKKAFHIVRVHCYSEGDGHSAQVYLNGVQIGSESSYDATSGVGYTVTIPCNVGDTIRMVVSCGGSGTYDKRNAQIFCLN